MILNLSGDIYTPDKDEQCTDIHGKIQKSSKEGQLDSVVLCRKHKDTEWLKEVIHNKILEVDCPSHLPKFPTKKWEATKQAQTV